MEKNAEIKEIRTRVLFTNATCMHSLDCEYNKGSAAIAASSTKVIKAFIPNAEFISLAQYTKPFAFAHNITVIENKTYSVSQRTFSLYNSLRSSANLIRCFCWSLVFNKSGKDIKWLIHNEILDQYKKSDIIIDLSMDLYSDNLGSIALAEHSKYLLYGVLFGKPVMVFAQSLGPFRTRLNSIIAKFTLNKVNVITVREELAMNYLKEIGVDKPSIHMTADPAFVLDPADKCRVIEILKKEGIDKNDSPLIGLTITPVIVAKALEKSKFTRSMKSIYKILLFILPDTGIKLLDNIIKNTNFYAKATKSLGGIEDILNIINYLNKELNATVLLIPHSITPEKILGPIGDDRSTAKYIFSLASPETKIKIIANDYSPEEIKGIIGHCDMFIGSKMHANIAALSQCIPVVGIAYSHKFYAIMKLLGMEKYICNKIDYNDLKSKIDDVWANREKIKSQLECSLPSIRERSMQNGKLAKELLDSIHQDKTRSHKSSLKTESDLKTELAN